MAIKKIKLTDVNHQNVLHPETETDMVRVSDNGVVGNFLCVKETNGENYAGTGRFIDIVNGLAYGGVVNHDSIITPDISCYYVTNDTGEFASFGDIMVLGGEKVNYLYYDNTTEAWCQDWLPWHRYSYMQGQIMILDDIELLLDDIVPSTASSSNKLLTENERHFKGWWPDLETLKAAYTATEGDSAYVHDASPATTWSIYVYDSTASSDEYWADSGTDADTTYVQTFASSQEVNEVHIVNDLTTGGVNDVLSAEQGKVLNETILNELYGEPTPIDLLKTATIIENNAINKDTGVPFTNNSYDIYTIPYDGTFTKISGKTTVYKNGIAVAFYNSDTMTAESFMAEYKVVGSGTSYGEKTYQEVQIPEGCVLIATVKYSTNTIECTTEKRTGGGVSGEIDNLNDSMADLNTVVEGVESNVQSINDILNLNNVNIQCDSNLVKYGLLNTDGTTAYVSSNNRGVSGFIEVQGGSDMIVISGAIQPPNHSYCPVCFYSSNTESSFVGYFQPQSEGSVVDGELLNITVPVPPTANYARFMLQEATIPVVVKFANPIESCVEQISTINSEIADINEQLANIDTDVVDFPQIRNNNLPTKAANEELNILLFGSSWGVDSIAALADICNNVGVPVNTGNMYKSGGTIAQYLDDVANNRTNTFFYNHGGTNESLGGKTVLQALQYKNWDIIIVMNSAVDSGGTGSATEIEGINTDFAKWLRYLKKNCSNPNVCFVINSTWTGKNEYSKLTNAFKIVRKLMKQSGIGIINPAGSAITYARTHTSLDNTNNLYRDSLHLNRGIGRFITAATMYYQLVYPIYGVGLDNCTITGHWDEAAETTTYPDIDVSESNIATCIECAKEGVCNQFQINIY